MTARPRILGRLETCRACDLSFDMLPGESTSSLIHRYTAWRDEHAHPDWVGPQRDEGAPAQTKRRHGKREKR